MATRAVYCSSHNTPQMPTSSHRVSDTGALRATFSSSHSSSNESLESGRERRRRGKNKMLQRIAELESQLSGTRQDLAARVHDLEGFQSLLAAATKRVSDLEQRNHCLSCLVDELTLRLKTEPPTTASPVLFDVFDLAEETTAVGCQTNISIDWSKPDRFFIVDAHGQLQALESSPSGQPVEPDVFLTLPFDQPAPSTSTADAAAGTAHAVGVPATESYQAWSGNGMATPRCLHTTLDGLRDTITDLQYHAWSGEGMATTGCLQATSTRLRISITDSTSDVGTWQAPDGDNSGHQVSDMQTQRVPLPLDFKSQDLANSSVVEPLGDVHTTDLPVGNSPEVLGQTQCGQLPHSTRRALDDNHTKHRVDTSMVFNSQDLALSAGPCAFETTKCAAHVCQGAFSQDHASASEPLAEYGQTQCGQPPQSTRRALEDHNSKHRVASLDFNSPNLALSARPVAVEQCTTLVGSGIDSQNLADTLEFLAEIGHTQCGHLPLSARQAVVVTNTKQSDTPVCLSINSQDLVHSSEPLDDCCGQTRCEHMPQNTRRALEDPNSKHRVDIPMDFNSQDLALSAEPLVLAADQPCTAHMCLSIISQDLANASEPLAVFGQTQCGHLPRDDTRQALEDHNSKHRVAQCTCSSINSQDSANSPESLADVGQTQCGHLPQSTWRELEDTHTKHQVATSMDFNSQDLATSARPCAFETTKCAAHVCQGPLSQDLASTFEPLADYGQTQCGHHRLALDDTNSKHRDASLDFNSSNLALFAGPYAFEQCTTHVGSSIDSSSLANTPEYLAEFGQTQCGQLPHSAGHALKDTNTKQCHAHGSSSTISQDLVGAPELLDDHESQQRGSEKDLVCAFTELAAPIIAAYTRRRNPSLKHIRKTASKIVHIAKQHGMTKESCCRHLLTFSMALSTAASEFDPW